MADECWSCRAEIDWAYSDKINPATGRQSRNPVERSSVDDPAGNLAVWRDQHGVLMFRYLRKDDELKPGEHRAVSHYAKCPMGAEWRGRRRHERQRPDTGRL